MKGKSSTNQLHQSAKALPGDRMTSLDHRILDALRDDGRVSISELATMLGVSRTTAYARIEHLEQSLAVRGYSAIVDPSRVGLPLTAVILLTFRQNGWRSVRDRIAKFAEVEFFALVTGPSDGLVIVRVPDMRAVHDVILERIQAMPEVRATQTLFVLEEVVHRPFVLPASS